MMSKFPFTPQGVQDMQAALYVLPDDQLHAVALSVRADFVAWLLDTFEFSASQLDFISSLNSFFLISTGDSAAVAIYNRLPITLTLLSGAKKSQGTTGKLVRKKNNTQESGDGDGEYEGEGDLEFEIEDPE